jgi:hypothetical protein
MRNKLFVIFGGQAERKSRGARGAMGRTGNSPDLDILKKSPCLQCQLYVENTMCVYVQRCSRIDAFQRVAAVHCTLYKDHDVFSILKV